MNDELADILFFIFDEERKQHVMPPQRVQQMLEKLKNMLYNDVSCEEKAETDGYG